MIVAQITDTHIAAEGSRFDRHFRTMSKLEQMVDHLNTLETRPDVVLLTGDTVDQGEAGEYARLRAVLAGLDAPLYVIPGNHDDRDRMREAFRDAPYLPREGFLHFVVDDFPLRLVGLDTLVPGEPGGALCSQRLAWLDARLGEAPARPTLIFMHHPPFRTGLAVMDGSGFAGADELSALLSRHPQVRQVLCGHMHRPITTLFGGTVASVCPSTAQQIELDLTQAERLRVVMEPPAAALVLWNEARGELVQHVSYVGERPLHTVYDGTSWGGEPHLPAGFHGDHV